MAVTLVAAAAFRWFGVDYSAGDPVDTTGWSDRAIAQLVKKAPVVSGGSAAGTPVVRKFPFAYNAAGLRTGHALYTPTVGDVLLDLWVEVNTPWNQDARGDIGTFVDSTTAGFFAVYGATMALDMTNDDRPYDTGTYQGRQASDARGSVIVSSAVDVLQVSGASVHLQQPNAVDGGDRPIPCRFLTTAPIKAVVSSDGSPQGTDPGATAGAATLYLVTATPA